MTEEEIFHEALVRTPADRAAYLDEACAGDPALRAGVESLLRANDGASGFLDVPAFLPPVDPATGDGPGTMIGAYRVMKRIGEGGFGDVFLAEQTEPVRREVALKVLRPGLDTRQVVARFEAERQALAIMDHPNIARVFDGGATPSGRPYFVMELVKGVAITAYCDAGRLTVRERVELFVLVCRAVQHAHQKGVIHRDIKPSNVLVESHDGKPVPKVIDFGIAKATARPSGGAATLTGAGVVVGTPAYMAPEQAAFDAVDVDTRADVYALGGLLYELLTGGPPFDPEQLKKAAAAEMLRIVREDEPLLPSAKLTTSDRRASVAAVRGVEPGKLGRLLRGDLDWIVMRCLEKDRGRRYETANGLARDVERFLNDEPVEARRPSVGYRLKKFVRRHRGRVVAGGLLVLALVAALAGVTWGLVRTRAERDAKDAALRVAETQTAITRAVNDFFQDDILRQAGSEDQADRGFEPDPDIKLKAVLKRAADRIGDRFRDRPLVEAAIRHAIGDAYRSLGECEPAVVHLRRAYELRAAGLGDNHPDTLATLTALAGSHRYLGHTQEAITLYERARDGWNTLPEADRTFALTTLNDLAGAYQDADRLADAVKLFEEVLEVRRRTIGPDHTQTLTTQNNLALAYRLSNRLPEAVAMYTEVLARKRATLRHDHPSVLITLSNLAVAHGVGGDWAKAVTLLEEVVASESGSLGADHPDALVTQYNLAGAYLAAGRLADAVKVYEFVYPNQLAKLTADHPDTRASRWQLAWTYMERGTAAEAVPHLEGLALSHRKDADEPTRLTRVLDRLAEAYQTSGRPDDAAKVLDEVTERKKQQHGPESVEAMASLMWLADCRNDSGRPDKAETALRDALSGSEKLRPDDWKTFLVRSLLGESLARQTKYVEAEPLLLAGYQGMKDKREDIPSRVRHNLGRAVDRIVDLYTLWGKPVKVEKWRAERAQYPPETAPPPRPAN